MAGRFSFLEPDMDTSNAVVTERYKPLFALGTVVTTTGADALLRKHNLHPIRFIARHLNGDWGDVSGADAVANREALTESGRLLSAYSLPGAEQLWVITECDRSVTTLLLPDES